MSKNTKGPEISLTKRIDVRLEFLTSNTVISLFIIGLVALGIRLLFFEESTGLGSDAFRFFQYAIDLNLIGKIPEGFVVLETGWPTFVAIVFTLFPNGEFMELVTVQRTLSLLISVLTILPTYWLCRHFFEKKYAMIGVAFFIFEPHIIQNSITGLSEPLSIFLSTLSLALLLNSNKKSTFSAFGLTAIMIIVRSVNIIFFPIFSIVFFMKNKINKRSLAIYSISLGIFILILTPVVILRAEYTESDPLISHLEGPATMFAPKENGINYQLSNVFTNGVTIMLTKLGQSMIPYFGLFVPVGIIFMLKNSTDNNKIILLVIGLTLLAILYVFSLINDIRYIFNLFPLFALISCFTIKKMTENIDIKNILLILLIFGVLLLSSYFLYSHDTSHRSTEAMNFAFYVYENTDVINRYYLSSYLQYPRYENVQFPIESSQIINDNPTLMKEFTQGDQIKMNITVENLDEFIKFGQSVGLTHLVVDNISKKDNYFHDAFYNEFEYPYLIKQYDTFANGYNYYHAKIFKIDYEKFEELKINIRN